MQNGDRLQDKTCHSDVALNPLTHRQCALLDHGEIHVLESEITHRPLTISVMYPLVKTGSQDRQTAIVEM